MRDSHFNLTDVGPVSKGGFTLAKSPVVGTYVSTKCLTWPRVEWKTQNMRVYDDEEFS